VHYGVDFEMLQKALVPQLTTITLLEGRKSSTWAGKIRRDGSEYC